MPGITDEEFPLDKPEKANDLMEWLNTRGTDLASPEYRESAHWAEIYKPIIAEKQAEIDRLTRERDEARDWVNRMVTETQVLRCACCGESYPPGTPDHNDDALIAHIKVCPKHPMREVETQLEKAKQALELASKYVNSSQFERVTGKAPHVDSVSSAIRKALEV